MWIEELGLRLYRQTLKRIHPAHIAIHWGMTQLIIPLLEKIKQFKTIPDDPFWFRLELLRGKHEPETTQLLDLLIKPGMIVLDIGAHVGYYSRRFVKKVGQNGRILSFEPHPKTYQTLQENVAPFPNILTFPVALSDHEGKAELHDYLVMSASGSLNYDPGMANMQKANQSKQDVAPRLEGGFKAQSFVVDTKRVDDCLALINITEVDVVKMDIEGAEIGALRGMEQIIQNSPTLALVMEYNPQALHGFGHDPVKALYEVLQMGFNSLSAIEVDGTLTNLLADRSALEERTEKLMTNMGVLNVLFKK